MWREWWASSKNGRDSQWTEWYLCLMTLESSFQILLVGRPLKKMFLRTLEKNKKTTTNFIDTQIHEHNCFIAGLMLSVSAFTMANKWTFKKQKKRCEKHPSIMPGVWILHRQPTRGHSTNFLMSRRVWNATKTTVTEQRWAIFRRTC